MAPSEETDERSSDNLLSELKESIPNQSLMEVERRAGETNLRNLERGPSSQKTALDMSEADGDHRASEPTAALSPEKDVVFDAGVVVDGQLDVSLDESLRKLGRSDQDLRLFVPEFLLSGLVLQAMRVVFVERGGGRSKVQQNAFRKNGRFPLTISRSRISPLGELLGQSVNLKLGSAEDDELGAVSHDFEEQPFPRVLDSQPL